MMHMKTQSEAYRLKEEKARNQNIIKR